MTARRLLLAALLLAASLAVTATVARGQRIEERWKRIAHDGVDAPTWMFDVAYMAASAAGYGAARLTTLGPRTSAAVVAVVAESFHVRLWLMGRKRSLLTGDDLFDLTTRAAPATVLAVCETQGRRWCVGALALLLASYAVTYRYASP